MDLRRFLPGLRSWTPRQIGFAAGLLAVSAGAGYCVYRYLQGQSAAADHTQPAHDSVDVLGESLDTPSVLQVVEPKLLVLPTEPQVDTSAVTLPPSAGELKRACCDVQVSPDSISSQSESVDMKREKETHHDTSAVILPPSAGELNRACSDDQVQTPDTFSSQSESVDMKREKETHHDTSAVILPPSAGELKRACSDDQVQTPDSISSQSESVDMKRDKETHHDTSAVILPPSAGELKRACCDVQVSPDSISSQSEEFSQFKETEDHLTETQVVEPYDELLPTASHDDLSAFVLPLTAGKLDHAWKNVQFLCADYFSSQSRSVEDKTCYFRMIRGPESVFCWFNNNKTCYLNHMGFPYVTRIEDCFTGIKSVSGRVTEYICCNHVESSVLVALEDYGHIFKKVTCTYLHVLEDGQVDTATWEKKEVCSPHSSQSNSEDGEERFSPEEVELPFISRHLSDREVTDMGLKLPALRQVFDTILGCMLNLNFLFLTGKKIVMQLAAANNQDAAQVRLAYEALIRFLRASSNQESIAAELSGAGLHFNFLDVFYELLIVGYYGNGFVPDPFEGGFLQRLMALVSMWDLDVWEPAAELYFTVLIDQLTELLEVLFSQPLELYDDPEALATASTRLMKQHVQLMMNTLENL
ncbi:uncharacterized protein LOC131347718 isoform X1 [Hemibagrus wyckioides]|uniref:uncharacterized protein LOC131347718 isoform X1 n=1 Tax=Hemibagrus wyckioides TaxID=337641 RepID=UPI00266C5693|nr:uncharacterized protein LOC131347718 isoform X1 [Hemibagrus wyckioides]